MRVHCLLHEVTCRLALAALQKAGAVLDRLTFSPGPRPARTPDAVRWSTAHLQRVASDQRRHLAAQRGDELAAVIGDEAEWASTFT
jgi:hypothetical protein